MPFTPADVPVTQGTPVFLYLVYDGTRAGEKDQVLGVACSLKPLLTESLIEKEFDVKDKDQLYFALSENAPPDSDNTAIILAAEAGGIDVLKCLKPQHNIVISHSAHQYIEDHAALNGIADIIALPGYLVTRDICQAIESSTTMLVQTMGVPHGLSPEVVKEAYHKNKDILPAADRYMGVILGGDAETPEGELRYYTAGEALQLADYVYTQVQETKAHLVILNGPRTGKHDPDTGKLVERSHRDGKVDPVTGAFVHSLEQKGVSKQDFTLLDFQFETVNSCSVVLGALLETKGSLLVAGESSSSISEAAECLPEGYVTVYTNEAMNDNHYKQIVCERESGRINILENLEGQWVLQQGETSRDTKIIKAAAEVIAEAVKRRISQKISK